MYFLIKKSIFIDYFLTIFYKLQRDASCYYTAFTK